MFARWEWRVTLHYILLSELLLGAVVTTLAIVLGVLCLVIAVLPARYDPAIRLKQWLDRHSS
jgi:hypothetical protein